MKILAVNKKVFHDYAIEETLEAGIVLSGDEVKSLRAGHVSLVGAFATVHGGELFLINCRISPYEKAFLKDEENATRRRKLLLHRRELDRLIGDVSQKGVTLVPLKIYLNKRSLIKIELGLAKHKKAADKRQAAKERDIKRETSRELKDNYRY
jgi:SsrA-binding protein